MSTNPINEKEIICDNCGHEFTSKTTLGEINCPKCESPKLSIHIEVHDRVKVRDWLRGKGKDDSFTGKKKLRRDFIVGSEQKASDGKWVYKERLIDKDNNRYKELVVDEETGEVIHECDEPLKNHFGHGSAKFKKDL